ncbi:MAG: ABC transporter permease [Propionivibrio sp.]
MSQSKSGHASRALLRALELTPIIMLVVLFLVFSVLAGDFFSLQNVENILLQSSYIGILAIGMTFVLLTAGIDLSVGTVMYVTAVVLAIVLNDLQLGLFLAVVASLLVCGGIGAITATLITRFRISAFIVTLAALSVWRGVALKFSQSQDINFSDAVLQLNTYRVFGVIPAPLIIFAVVAVIGQIILRYTVYGRQIMAVGQDTESARKAGLPVGRILASVYVISAMAAALASVISIAQLGTVNAGFAQGIEFKAISAAVLGGASLFGGRGSILPGAVIGSVLMQTISAGLQYVNVDLYMEPIITALIIFFAVFLDSLRSRIVRQLQRKHIRIEE